MPSTKFFGHVQCGQETHLYTLENAAGFRAEITNYGAAIVRLLTLDRTGALADVVLGYDHVEGYVTHSSYFGAVIGRYGNRIADGRFSLNGKSYSLAKNNSPGGMACHLHGGLVGFDKVVWTAEPLTTKSGDALRLRYSSRTGEEGFPGNLDVTVTYTVTSDNALKIEYLATTDQPTPVNLTNHSYFNLAGEGQGDVLDHVITLHATHYTPVDAGLIPLGQLATVADTPLDFRTPQRIGARIGSEHEQLKLAGGYDHNFVLDHPRDGNAALAATVYESKSGRVMDVFTSEPGVQFYTGNFLNGKSVGKNGHAYRYRGGLCLETQHYPDSPNQPAFPTTILKPGETLRSTTLYRFEVR